MYVRSFIKKFMARYRGRMLAAFKKSNLTLENKYSMMLMKINEFRNILKLVNKRRLLLVLKRRRLRYINLINKRLFEVYNAKILKRRLFFKKRKFFNLRNIKLSRKKDNLFHVKRYFHNMASNFFKLKYNSSSRNVKLHKNNLIGQKKMYKTRKQAKKIVRFNKVNKKPLFRWNKFRRELSCKKVYGNFEWWAGQLLHMRLRKGYQFNTLLVTMRRIVMLYYTRIKKREISNIARVVAFFHFKRTLRRFFLNYRSSLGREYWNHNREGRFKFKFLQKKKIFVPRIVSMPKVAFIDRYDLSDEKFGFLKKKFGPVGNWKVLNRKRNRRVWLRCVGKAVWRVRQLKKIFSVQEKHETRNRF